MRLLRPRRLLHLVYRALVAYGTFYTGPDPGGPAEKLTGPVPGHPERVCEERPLTPLERSLLEELQSH